MYFLREAENIANRATCMRSKCGSVIVKDQKIIGLGFNSPPHHLDSQCRCLNEKDKYHKKITDKTCCIHAEQRAIFDALSKNPSELLGARLYFARIDDEGKIKISGKPYCTICSKSALDVGISEFILLTDEGITIYDTEEYNDASFDYKG